jgi:tetratricopeptide (TPR) repeat protein
MPGFETKKNKDLILMITALGDTYLDKGLYAEAAKRYNQLLKMKVANRHVYTNLSKALIGMKRFDKTALSVFQRAIQHDPGNQEIFTILAKAFLEEGREDEKALQIYERALRNDSPIFVDISHTLSRLYFQNQEYQKCFAVLATLLAKNGHEKEVTGRFIEVAWITKQFNSAIGQLKKLIDVAEDKTELLQHLGRTYLEKRYHGQRERSKISFSYIDRQLINDFLATTQRFARLSNLTLYIESKRFLQQAEYWGNLVEYEHQITPEEYVYETGEEPAHAVKALRKGFDFNKEVISRIRSFDQPTSESMPTPSSLTFEDFQKQGPGIFVESGTEIQTSTIPEHADILITAQIANYDKWMQDHGEENAQRIHQSILHTMKELSVKYRLTRICGLDDGFLVFSDEIINAVTFCVDMLNRISRDNQLNEDKEPLSLLFGIHHSRDGFSSRSEHLLKDLSIALKTGTITSDDLPEDDKATFGKAIDKGNRIFLSGKAYREIKSSNRFKVNTLGQFHPKYLSEKLSVHEVIWRNPVQDLKFGYVKRLGRFDLLAEIGPKESDIKVYKAKDADLQRFVIIKVIQSEVFNSLPSNNPHKIEFFQIAKSFGQMNHPNIANIYDVDEDAGLTYIAREFIEGDTIKELFAQESTLQVERLIQVMYNVFRGLQYCHRLGFCHHNLKPNNIRIGSNNETKLMDFYVPSAVFDEHGRTEEGRNYYLSPEQVQGQRGDNRSDVFSMGVILYEIATGEHPFRNARSGEFREAILRYNPVMPSQVQNAVPKFLDVLIMKCLTKHPDKRVQSVEQIIGLLKKNFERTLFSSFNYQIAQSRDSY